MSERFLSIYHDVCFHLVRRPSRRILLWR